jgi:hypothetical protein
MVATQHLQLPPPLSSNVQGIYEYIFTDTHLETLNRWFAFHRRLYRRRQGEQAATIAVLNDCTTLDVFPFAYTANLAYQWAKTASCYLPTRHAFLIQDSPMTRYAHHIARRLEQQLDYRLMVFKPEEHDAALAWLMDEQRTAPQTPIPFPINERPHRTD